MLCFSVLVVFGCCFVVVLLFAVCFISLLWYLVLVWWFCFVYCGCLYCWLGCAFGLWLICCVCNCLPWWCCGLLRCGLIDVAVVC